MRLDAGVQPAAAQPARRGMPAMRVPRSAGVPSTAPHSCTALRSLTVTPACWGQLACDAAAVEDLMTLVQACRAAPDMEARLRETLNMARDAEKWRNLIRMLTEKVRDACVCLWFLGGR